MKSFPLKIVTPDGPFFEGSAQSVTVRTILGDVGIMAGHIDFVTALGMGKCTVKSEDGTRHASCIGGMLTVSRGKVTLIATTFEWADEIDIPRAQLALDNAQAILDDPRHHTPEELAIAGARRRRAQVRLGVAE